MAEGAIAIPETELATATITDNVETENAGIDFDPLFVEEAVTDAELMGEVTTDEETAGSGPTGDETKEKAGEETDEARAEREKAEKEAGEEKTEAEKAEAEKAATEKEAAEKAKAEKAAEPSREMVEKTDQVAGLTRAVQDERRTVSTLKAENQRLAAELANANAPKADDKDAETWKDFKILSVEDYNNLLDEDPDEANRYLHKSGLYRDYQDGVNKRQLSEHQAKTAGQEIVNYGIQELEKVLPGISQGKNEMVDTLTDFAEKHGVDPSILEVFTNPSTKVITAKGENMYVGDGAAQLVSLIKSTFEAVSNVPNETKIRTEIEAELRPKIEAEVQEVFIEKLKQDPSGGSFRSLDNLTGGASKEVKPVTGTVSEAEWNNMSEQDRAASLGM